MYYSIVRQFAHTLRNLDACLVKAEQYAKARGFDVNNYCSTRLFPDMLPFVAQIRIACDQAKSTTANLSGKPAPRHEDNEKTFEELHARIASCLEYLDSVQEADCANIDASRVVSVPFPRGKAMVLNEYVLSRQIPQFFFHVTTAYALLRHGGVELGKADYLGAINMQDAP